MKIISNAFVDNGNIPSAYTCDGDRFLSPPLSFQDVPENTHSLVLIVDDPDVPKEIREDQNFTHWVLFNIPPHIKNFSEGEFFGTLGLNTRGEAKYTGPCPPSEYEPSEHRYYFKLYALDILLDLSVGASKDELIRAMEGHILTEAVLMGRYQKLI